MIDALEMACERRRRGQPVVLATVVRRRAPSSGRPGFRAVVDADGHLHGWVGGACAGPVIVREALRALREGSPRLVVLGTSRDPDDAEGVVSLPMTCQSEGALEVFLEPLLPPPLLCVVGRSPAVEALGAMAGTLGWRVVTLDAPGDDLGAAGVADGSYVVVATQGEGDEEALRRALATPAAYVGLVASRRRALSLLAQLAEQGVPESDLRRVRAPAGLDLGPIAHTEIAVAILAELVRLRAGGGPVAGVPEPAPRDEVVDPVCGMTVDALTSPHRATHDGREHCFCAAGCRTRFVADPGRYAAVGR